MIYSDFLEKREPFIKELNKLVIEFRKTIKPKFKKGNLLRVKVYAFEYVEITDNNNLFQIHPKSKNLYLDTNKLKFYAIDLIQVKIDGLKSNLPDLFYKHYIHIRVIDLSFDPTTMKELNFLLKKTLLENDIKLKQIELKTLLQSNDTYKK